MRLGPESSPFPRVLAFPLLLFVSGAAYATVRGLPFPLLTRPCPLLTLTGVPCPTCGSTRAFAALVRGDWAAAWTANPFAVTAGALVALWMLHGLAASAVPRWRFSIVASRREKTAAVWTAAVLMMLSWVYQVRLA